MPSSWTQNYYHLVFSTKKRQPLITADIHERLYPFFGGIARDLRAQSLASNGMPDHVHLLLRFPPDIAPAVLAREPKARSSKWIHDTFPKMRSFKWQRGYGGFTVSASQVPKTKTYIHNQVKHHVKMTFEQEFLAMLDKNDVDYDRRYVFE